MGFHTFEKEVGLQVLNGKAMQTFI